MKKGISGALCIAMALQVTLMAGPARADAINYTPVAGHTGGLLDGTVAVSRVGAVQLNGALASFQGNAFQVRTSESTSNPALFGVLLDPRVDGAGHKAKYQAVAFCQGGDVLPRLTGSTAAPESVVLSDDTELNGTITSLENGNLTINTPQGSRSVPMTNVAAMTSPRLVDVTLVAQAGNTIEAGKPFSADSGNVRVSMTQHRGCYPETHRRHVTRVMTQPAVTTSTTTTSTSTPVATQSTTLGTTCAPTTVMSQPAVCATPVVTACKEHSNWLLGALVAGAVIATAIAVPLGVTAHERHERRARRRQQQLLAQQYALYYYRPTP